MGLSLQSWVLSLFVLLAFSSQVHAFGAGNIASLSKIEGQNWRHGDIEDALLSLFLARVVGGRKFGKLDVKRVYFGNWLRDYSQAVDVGTCKYVSAEAIRILIWVLGFMSFGYGTREFEVTTERLGCYQPTEHIDNPKGYAEGDDARRYDRRLRGPVDERRELSIDPRTGLKSYIASEDMGIDTSAELIRRVLGKSIQMGRRYSRSRNDDDLYEALRLLGTGLHCLEDYAAHSNYTELSLLELGERDVFPHVGRDTKVEIRGARHPVYPIVTGTFGGVDFFHSVLGELSDKTMQSELQSLEGAISESEGDSPSLLQDLLSKIPSGLLGDNDDQSGKMDDFKSKADDARQNNQNISPREPEEWTRYLDDVHKQIYPVLQWHDELLQKINQAIEKIPPPYVLPIIKQVKSELETGSSEVIQSSREQQHIVFNDDSCSDPTHSMLSKDHFSNILNEPAGRIASSVVKWAVPQLMQCWDDENADIDRTLTRIISGVFHHPALREYGEDGAGEMRQTMFSTVEQWWSEKSDRERGSLRDQLSRDGVLKGRNHKEGVQDCGHGCGKPLALPAGKHSSSGGGSGGSSYGHGQNRPSKNDTGLEKIASEAVGGGALGGLVGGLVGGVGSMILDDGKEERKTPKPRRNDSGDEKYERRHQNKPHKNESDDSDEERKHRQRHQPQHHQRPEHESGYQQQSYGGASQSGYGRSEYQSETSSYGQAPRRDEYSSGRPHGGDYQSGSQSYGGSYGGSGGGSYGNDSYGGASGGASYGASSGGASYGGSSGGYGGSSSGYGGSSGGYGGSSGGYGGSSGGYGASSDGYGGSSGGYGGSYGEAPVRRDEYSQPSAPNYHREQYQQSGNSSYYQEERRETHGGRTEYQRTETRYDYSSPQSTYETVQQSSYSRSGYEHTEIHRPDMADNAAAIVSMNDLLTVPQRAMDSDMKVAVEVSIAVALAVVITTIIVAVARDQDRIKKILSSSCHRSRN
ncbi:uncharacterized protein N7469_005200 [Penicillium citrinum]|uniref:NIMA-interacting protein TinC n=1 Tax=Penicillium citrinum TaxID=5077 RepID=A0A9W9P0T0_PENCI|nr:uncharacterized protein N7469_005200 [Penicillium citrinum]KAJ5233434.1 hypothetical protein N7469_005200 [Penicillium citrinum]